MSLGGLRARCQEATPSYLLIFTMVLKHLLSIMSPGISLCSWQHIAVLQYQEDPGCCESSPRQALRLPPAAELLAPGTAHVGQPARHGAPAWACPAAPL